jgi:hypothetical protein
VNDAAAESVLVGQLEIDARSRAVRVAPAEDDRPDEQGHLVDQAGGKRLCREIRDTDEKTSSNASQPSSTRPPATSPSAQPSSERPRDSRPRDSDQSSMSRAAARRNRTGLGIVSR